MISRSRRPQFTQLQVRVGIRRLFVYDTSVICSYIRCFSFAGTYDMVIQGMDTFRFFCRVPSASGANTVCVYTIFKLVEVYIIPSSSLVVLVLFYSVSFTGCLSLGYYYYNTFRFFSFPWESFAGQAFYIFIFTVFLIVSSSSSSSLLNCNCSWVSWVSRVRHSYFTK